jgi:hypothetical protein
MRKEKSRPLSIRVPDSVKKAAEKAAVDDGRTVSNLSGPPHSAQRSRWASASSVSPIEIRGSQLIGRLRAVCGLLMAPRYGTNMGQPHRP